MAPSSGPLHRGLAKSAFFRESYRSDGSLDAVVVDLYAAVGQEDTEAVPIFNSEGQSLAEWGLGHTMRRR